MQIMHLCLIGIFVLDVLENLTNGGLIFFFSFLSLVLATARMGSQVCGFMAGGSVILLSLSLSQNDSASGVKIGKGGFSNVCPFLPRTLILCLSPV